MRQARRLLAWVAAAALFCGQSVAQPVISGGGAGSGSGSVTSIATGACLTGGTITTTGTITGTYAINAQVGTSYTILSTDACNLVSFSNASAIAVTLPQATGSFAAGFSFDVSDIGAGIVTITPTTSTINGAATLTLAKGQSCSIVSDGTNWQVSSCTGIPIIWNQQQSNSIKTLTISTATFTPDGTQNNYKITLIHASCPCTLANPGATPVAGTSGIIQVIQSSTGSDTIGTYGSQYISAGGTSTLALSSGANAQDFLSYYVIDSTHILLSTGALNASH